MTDLPNELGYAIYLAYESVLVDGDHALRPYLRAQIYRRLDWQTRGRLAILTVRRYLYIWYRAQPDNNLLEDWLATAERFIQGKISRNYLELLSEAVDLLTNPDIRSRQMMKLEKEDWHPVCILNAVASTLKEILQHPNFDNDHRIDLTWEDGYLVDAGYPDTALWVAVGYAGHLWESESNPEKRLEFWTWWLEEAVPLAWNLVHESLSQQDPGSDFREQ